MAKYTIKNVIIDSQDQRLEGAIGKTVYCGYTPKGCVQFANMNDKEHLGVFDGIEYDNCFPFIVNGICYTCIILNIEES